MFVTREVVTGVPLVVVVEPSLYVVTVTGVVTVVVVVGVVVVVVTVKYVVTTKLPFASVEFTIFVLVTEVTTGVPSTLLDVTIGVPGAVLKTVGDVLLLGAFEPGFGEIGPNGVEKFNVVPTSCNYHSTTFPFIYVFEI